MAPALVWFRDDLRLADNPALTAAAELGPVLALYVLEENAGRPLGGAARWWLAGSLRSLAAALAARGVPLVLRRGDPRRVVPRAAEEAGAAAVFWNRRAEPGAAAADRGVEAVLRDAGRPAESFEAGELHAPASIASSRGGAIPAFAAWWRKAQARGPARPPLPVPEPLGSAPALGGDRLEDLGLEPTAPDWAGSLRATWTPGEDAAQRALGAFVADGLAAYAERRDRVDAIGSARLSPHLRFGEISPFQVAAALERSGQGSEKFAAELGWRDYARHLLHFFPDLATRNAKPAFDRFPWRNEPADFAAWRRGRTGYPIVDAAMRELWRTGWMPNRLRMVTASFLVKHLLVDWRIGEAWFWDTLVDADPASNPVNWQWVAGSGPDAAPFFRIFNPVLQGERFDPGAGFVRAALPELESLPDAFVHRPWEAPAAVLREAGVRLGETYPAPIIEHGFARARALAASAEMRGPARS